MIGDKQNLNPKIVTPSQNNTIKLNVKKNALKLNLMETKKKCHVLNLRVSRPLDCEHHYVLVVQVVLGQARLAEQPLLTVWGPLFGFRGRDPKTQ